MIKDLILGAFRDEAGEVNQVKLEAAIQEITSSTKELKARYTKSLNAFLWLQDGKNQQANQTWLEESFSYLAPKEKVKGFQELTLNEYIELLLRKDGWDYLCSISEIKLDTNDLRNLFVEVRDIRNTLAHFRGDISSIQRGHLRFCEEWLSGHQRPIQTEGPIQRVDKVVVVDDKGTGVDTHEISSSLNIYLEGTDQLAPVEEQAGPKDSRYAPLADFLQNTPGSTDRIQMTFEDIEGIIEDELPASARLHRAWWSNDATPYRQSNSWLDVGWRTTYINMGEGKVTFARIREREKAYIEFFSRLLVELRKKPAPRVRDLSPDGASWIFINGVPEPGPQYAFFGFSFSRNNLLRVEMYIDAYSQEKTKQIFDTLKSQRDYFESQVGPLNWERIDKKRGSRIAQYHPGAITDDPKKLLELRHWAVEAMVKFQQAFKERASQVIQEVMDK